MHRTGSKVSDLSSWENGVAIRFVDKGNVSKRMWWCDKFTLGHRISAMTVKTSI